MPKKIADMTPKGRREAHKKVWEEVVEKKKSVKTEPVTESRIETDYIPMYSNLNSSKKPSKRSGSRYGLWVVAVCSVLFLVFSFSVIFAGAPLTVGPRIENLNLNQNLNAVKGGAEGVLPFDLMVISGDEVQEVEGGEEVDVSRKATGKVILYNAFGAASQKLAIDTRLEGSNGKIYKTKKEVTIPGMKGTTPGSIEVDIYANEAGASYNSGPLDFTIFGFKGTSKYSKFYGRSKGDIRGGFVGKEREVSEEQKVKILDELHTKLENSLIQKAKDQIPSGFILYKNAASVVVEDETFTSKPEGNTVEVKASGTLHGVLFEEKALTREIIKKKFPGEENNDIYIQNIRDLNFSVVDESSFPGFASVENLNFTLTGESKAVWKVDEEKLMSDVVGQKKSNLDQVLSQHANIISADLSLKPFWKRTLPGDKENIKTIITYP